MANDNGIGLVAPDAPDRGRSWRVSVSRSADASPGYQQHFSVQFVLSMRELGTVISARSWSPIVFRGGTRREAAFAEADLMALDFDTPEYSLDQCLRDFADSTHVIGTTRSHRISKGGIVCDRFRVVVPYAEAIRSLPLYRHNLKRRIRSYGADPACSDGARFFWPCATIVSFNENGYFESVEPIPAATGVRGRKVPGGITRGLWRPVGLPTAWAAAALRSGVPPGSRNITCFRLGAVLYKVGYSESEIISAVEASPIMQPGDPSFPASEMRRAIRNGIACAAREMVMINSEIRGATHVEDNN